MKSLRRWILFIGRRGACSSRWFLGQSRTPVPTRFDCFPWFNACRGGYYPPAFYKIKSIFYFSRSSWASIASRTFGWRSGNIANSSESENCQGNFQDLQKDLVVLRDLMLHLIKLQIERDPSVVGEPLPRLFSPIAVEKRFDAAAVLPHHPIAQISRRSAQDDLFK